MQNNRWMTDATVRAGRWVLALMMALMWSASVLFATVTRTAMATPAPACFATIDGVTVYSSADAQAVRDAVAAASSGDVVKLAGTCTGVSGAQVVVVNVELTLQGGYTDGAWAVEPSSSNPTVLDAQQAGRVISATAALTIENLTVQNGAITGQNGAGAYVSPQAVIVSSKFLSNSVTTGNGGGVYVTTRAHISGSHFISNTVTGSVSTGIGGGVWVGVTSYFTNSTATDNVGIVGGIHSQQGWHVFDSVFERNRGANGALYSGTPSTIYRSTFRNNFAGQYGTVVLNGNGYQPSYIYDSLVISNTGAPAIGGIYARNGADIYNTRFIANSNSNTTSNAGGGALRCEGLCRIYGAWFERNVVSGYGGAIRLSGSSHLISNSIFLSNTAGIDGGAVYNGNARPHIIGSQFIGNTARRGGALWQWSDQGIDIEDTIFLRNLAGEGGAIFQYDNWEVGTTHLTNTLFASNVATNTGGAADIRMDGQNDTTPFDFVGAHLTFVGAGKSIKLGSSTVADRLALTNTIFSGYSVAIDKANTGASTLNKTLWFSVATQISGTGVTSANAITGSPDFVNTAADDYRISGAGVDVGVATGVARDIAGRARPYGAGSDIGAYEFVPNCFAEYTGDNTTDFSSIDARAVHSAVVAATAGNVVKIAGTCAGAAVSYDGTTQLVKVKKNLTLRGGYTDGAWTSEPSTTNRAVLDAQETGKVLRVDTGAYPQANVTLENLVIQNGRVSNDNGGGAVFKGDVVLSNTMFYSNSAVPASYTTYGGGFTIDGGNLMITASQFIQNYASRGGAVYYNPENSGALVVVDSEFLTNTATGEGAGIYINANTATILSTEFTSNTAGTGGGFWTSRVTNATNVTFERNAATASGGGAYATNTFTGRGITATNNSAATNGGGLYSSGTTTVYTSTLLTNTAALGGGAYFGAATVDSLTAENNTATGTTGGGVHFNGAATVSNSTFRNNRTTGSGFTAIGGGAYFNGAATVDRSAFEANSTLNGHGGGAYFTSTATVTGTIFSGNVVTGTSNLIPSEAGGAYFRSAATLTNSQFVSNTAYGEGGGMFAASMSLTTTLHDTHFYSNVALVGDGGGLFAYSPLVVNGGEYKWNVVANQRTNLYRGGGALFVTKTSLGAVGARRITGATFVGNRAAHPNSYGGALVTDMFAGSDKVEVIDSVFEDNVAGDYGGAWSENNSGTIYSVRNVFRNNQAGGIGGAVAVWNSAYVTDTQFYGNSANRGGGLSNDTSSERIEVYSSTFEANTATTSGGGLHSAGALMVDASTFQSNTAATSGGGAYSENAVTITNTTFVSNTANYGGGARVGRESVVHGATFERNAAGNEAGGLYSPGGNLTVTASSFTSNVGKWSGGAASVDSALIVDSTFLSNTAWSGGGGALYPNASLVVSNSTFTANSAGSGSGGAVLVGTRLSIEASRFEQNTATSSGGALYLGSPTTVTKSVFVDNTSPKGQLMIVGRVYMENNVVAGASGGYGLFVSGSGAAAVLNAQHTTIVGTDTGVYAGDGGRADQAVLTNTIFAGHGVGAAISGTGSVTLTGVLWDGVTTPTSGTVNVSGAVTGTAAFVDVAGGDYQANGDAIDGGVDGGVAEDILGRARPQGAGYDLGAYEGGDVALGNLEVVPGELTPTFVSTTNRYTMALSGGVSTLVVTATVHDVSATVAYASSAGACTGGDCPVIAGKTRVTATVTGADGVTVREYYIEVTQPSNDAALSDLAIAPGMLAPAFVSGTTSYAAEVPHGTTQVQITATVRHVSATVVYSTSAGSCQASDCAVAGPKTWVTVTVTAEDGATIEEYSVEITVAPPSTDASLTSLELDRVTLTPAFVSTTTSYTAEVPNGTTQVLVTATPNDAGATVAYATSAGSCVVGARLASPAASPAARSDASLAPTYCAVAGPKTWITVTVTAADAQTTEEYYIEIAVADANASTDATLGDLAIAPGTLAPAFVSTTKSYVAGVSNGTTSMAVTAAPNDAGATVAYASSAGACAAPAARGAFAHTCVVAGPKTWITVTVTAADGITTEKYSIEITVAAPLTTIDRVWPGTGLPAGGMPVQIFGTGFVAALTVTVGPYTDGLRIDVPFVPVNDKQINFVMPAGIAGQRVSVTVATADSAQTAANAFTYVQPEVIEFEGNTGGVFTTTDGVVVTIPPQGITGTFFLTMTPLPPAPGVPGNVLMYSFRLDAVLNGFELETLTNPVTIMLPIDEGIFAISDGERPWLYSWTADGRRLTAAETTAVGGRRSAVGGRWVLVRGQEYDAGTQVMTVALRPMGLYALSSAYVREYWFPVVPVLK